MTTTSVPPGDRPSRFGLGIDHLWLAIVLAGFGFYTSLVPLPPNDFWWHLKIGEIIYTSGTIPQTNMFGWTLAPDFPFTYGAWLGEYLFYVLYRWGEMPLVIFTRTVLVMSAFGLVGYQAHRRSGSWRIAALAVVLACSMAANNLIVRPQNWSWLVFMIFLILLSSYSDGRIKGRWLLLCPLLVIFWVNAHGAFILGPVMMGIFFVGEAVRTVLQLPGARPWKAVAWIGVVGGLTILATAVNPQGIGIFAYVKDLMTDRPSQQLIVEWQSPTPEGPANITFFVSILVTMAALAYSRYRLTPTDLLLVTGFLWLAWSGQRYVVWFGFVSMPVLAQALSQLALPAVWQKKRESLTAAPSRNMLNAILAILIFAPVVLVQPWLVERVPLPPSYWKLVWRGAPAGPLLSVQTPVAATDYLKQHPGGKLFNEMGYGSYLIWAMPEQGVFIDPRVELYPFEQWQDYIKIAKGNRYNELLAKYGVDRIVLDVEKQTDLAELLELDPLWRKEYQDQHAQIWIKSSE